MLKKHFRVILALAVAVIFMALSACSADMKIPVTGGLSILVSPTRPVDSQPVMLNPGDTLVLHVTGFPPDQTINIFLNLPNGAVGPLLNTFKTDERGQANVMFVMPSRLPDGQVINQQNLSLLVTTPDYSVKQEVALLFHQK